MGDEQQNAPRSQINNMSRICGCKNREQQKHEKARRRRWFVRFFRANEVCGRGCKESIIHCILEASRSFEKTTLACFALAFETLIAALQEQPAGITLQPAAWRREPSAAFLRLWHLCLFKGPVPRQQNDYRNSSSLPGLGLGLLLYENDVP